jgi:anaerobic nitric oxide reductase transcription regulator
VHLDIGALEATGMPAPSGDLSGSGGEGALDGLLSQYERDVILAAVARHKGNWAAAAKALGMHRSNLHRRAVRLGLKGSLQGSGIGDQGSVQR